MINVFMITYTAVCLATVTGSVAQTTQTFQSIDEHPIFYREWKHEAEEHVAVVYLIHGMAEHSGRYNAFATHLVQTLGVKVVAPDHRGHGMTSCPEGAENLVNLGFLHRGVGFETIDPITLMGKDVIELIRRTNEEGKPIMLFGHSMGSVISRSVLRNADPVVRNSIKGVVLSGVPTAPSKLEYPALRAASTLIKWSGGVGLGFVQKTLIGEKFDSLVKRRVGDSTLPENCFISSDADVVAEYTREPFTDHLVDADILISVVSNLMDMSNNPAEYFEPITDVRIPTMFICGRDDPVCMFGATAQADAEKMAKLGHPITEVYLSGARHEFLNEIQEIRLTGIQQVTSWMKQRIFNV